MRIMKSRKVLKHNSLMQEVGSLSFVCVSCEGRKVCNYMMVTKQPCSKHFAVFQVGSVFY